MAHIHLEDGSFTLFWVIVWWAVALLLIGSALYFIRRQRVTDQHRIILAGFCVAAAFVLSQVELPIPGGAVHISLTPLIAILTGPVIGLFIVFITNILSAAIGHGGWSMIGANTLVGLSEILVAYAIWRGLKPFIQNIFVRSVTATICGLILGNFVMMGIIALSGIQGVSQSMEQIITGLFLVASINIAVAVVEALMTGLVITYIGKMRPDLVDGAE